MPDGDVHGHNAANLNVALAVRPRFVRIHEKIEHGPIAQQNIRPLSENQLVVVL